MSLRPSSRFVPSTPSSQQKSSQQKSSQQKSCVLVRSLGIALVVASLAWGGCATWSNEIRQAEIAYDEARPEAALAWLDVVTDDNLGRLGEADRIRYLYLRGMTEFRLGRRDDALYHLAVARELAGREGLGLRREQRELMDRTLTELTPTEMLSHRAAGPASAP
jgi:hypothetical protein